MKRILFLVNHDVVIYNFRLEIVERFLSDGHEVHVSSPYGERIDALVELGCKYHEVHLSRHGMNPIKEMGLIQYYKKLIREVKPDIVFVDGNRLPELDIPAEYVIHGDAVSASIAAASILAKVSRDRFMYEMDKKYPEYDFAKHKGYGTKLHYEKLREFGPCEIHRLTFLKKMH